MNEPINMHLTVNEVSLVLDALSNMACYKVREVISKIQSQAQQQLNNIANTPVTTDNSAYIE